MADRFISGIEFSFKVIFFIWKSLWVVLLASALAAWPFVVEASEGVTSVGDSPVAIQEWQAILAFVQPIILAFIIQSGWSRAVQSTFAFLFSVAATTVGIWLHGDFNGVTDWVTSFMTVFAMSIPFYYGFWKPTGIAPRVEAATSKT
jgi:hypothetical protein